MQITVMRLLSAWVILWRLSVGSATAEPVEPALPPGVPPTLVLTTPVPLPTTGGSLTDQAIARWTQQVKQATQDDAAWVQLGEAFMQKARETVDPSYYGRAEAAFQRALALNPQHVAALTGIAWVHGVRHDFEQSVVWAQKAVAHDPSHQAAYGLLGDAAVEMGDYDTAFEHYQKMLDLRPDLSSYSRAAHLLYLSGDQRRAVWMMHKAIAAGAPYAENTAWCRAQLALLLWSNGALLPAEQILEGAIKETPNNYHVLAAMGKVKTARQEYQSAIDYYKRASAIAPQPEALIALGDLYRLTERPEEADQQYTLVETIHQLHKANGIRDDIQILRFYADHERKLPEALQEAEAVHRTRKNIYAADVLAWCYYKNGRYAEARKAIKKALSQRTSDAQLLFHAGMIYAKLGEQSTAKQYLYQALSLNPHFHPLDAPLAAETLKRLSIH